MDKFVTRRARSSSTSNGPDDRRPKRVKTEKAGHEGSGHPQSILGAQDGTNQACEESGQVEDEEKAALDRDRDGPLEEAYAPVESRDEAVDGVYGGEDLGSTTGIIRYTSSIYVDAFNIALDTVLEQEEHLFNDQEKAVFAAWRRLDYEAQYLYVRLFLRKQAVWHRTQRLDYHSNIADLQSAVELLRQPRGLPPCQEAAVEKIALSEMLPPEWALGSSFVFAQTLDDVDTTVEEAVALLSLDELKELAKQMKTAGRTKAELQAAIVNVATKQRTLLSVGLRRQSSTQSSTDTAAAETPAGPPEISGTAAADPFRGMRQRRSSGREGQLIAHVKAITGPCVRVCPSIFKLFERVHLVFYRSSEWTEKSLTTLVLAKMAKRSYPDYVVSRTANIFESRQHLLGFEEALRLEHKVDWILNFAGSAGEQGFQEAIALFRSMAGQWRALLQQEQQVPDPGGDVCHTSYLRRFKPAHIFTRVAHYAAYCFGRLHEYREEYALLNELLAQRHFHRARRGAWYQRKALLEEHYMAAADPDPALGDAGQQKKHWLRRALKTCEQALQDRDCHLIYHYDVQKRVVKLEKKLRIPRRLQHDFRHVQLLAPEEHAVTGVQIKSEGGGERCARKGSGSQGSQGAGGTRTLWLDELDGSSGGCSVETMCLNDYRRRGWKGFHSEGGIVRTLFGYLFYDLLFLSIPNVFQTAYQACPLDLHTDAFYAARASEINERLAAIANGEAPRIVRAVHAAQGARRTCVVGLQWDFALEDVVELAQCFRGDALALVCKVLAQEYRQRGGGLPDLLLWRTEPQREVLFSEVKSANDRLSDTQRMWIHVLAGAGVRVAVCHAIARETQAQTRTRTQTQTQTTR